MTLFYYQFNKGSDYIRLEGEGKNPSKCKQVKWSCNEGNDDLKIINDPISDFITAYGSVLQYSDHPNNLYIQANKFGYLLKYNYIHQENNFIKFDHNKTVMIKKGEKTIKVKGHRTKTGYVKPHERKVKPGEKKPIVEKKIIIDFIPAKNEIEIKNRFNKFIRIKDDQMTFKEYGINFDGLKLEQQNSILKGIEKVFNKYNVQLDFIGWNKKRQKNIVAQYDTIGEDVYKSIKFQKTATKGIKSRQKKNIEYFEINKKENIAKMERYLTYKEMRSGDHDRDRKKIIKYKACKRWTVDVDANDMLAATTVHECNHAIYYKYKLESKWKDNLTYHVGNDMHNNIKCASVSEYGMSSERELFAEVGAAVAFGIEIDPDVKQAYLDTVRGINR